MKKIKQQSVGDVFYPNSKNELENLFSGFEKDLNEKFINKTRALIIPHAGYIYSGKLAYQAMKNLDNNTENVFIIAPSHHFPLFNMGLCDYDSFLTPFGEIYQNLKIVNEIKYEFNLEFNNDAFNMEHSIEVQLPILKYLYKNKDFKIVSILTCANSSKEISKIISKYWKDEKNSFIISSDLSHFLNHTEAEKTDERTAQMIETDDVLTFDNKRACGLEGILALKEFTLNNNFSLIRIGLLNSSKANNDKTRVVGYGAWRLFEGSKNEFIKKYFSDFILKICKKSIEQKGSYFPENYDCVFDELGACFVTLEINGFLRGCIGSIIAYEPLIDNLVKNAYNSAYKDPRFNPLEKEEIDKIEIKVSILSSPVEIEFESEEELLCKIVPFKDGIIIKDGAYQAVYLPSVWDDINDKKQFLNSLKIKAGLKQDYFSKTFRAFRFYSEYIV